MRPIALLVVFCTVAVAATTASDTCRCIQEEAVRSTVEALLRRREYEQALVTIERLPTSTSACRVRRTLWKAAYHTAKNDGDSVLQAVRSLTTMSGPEKDCPDIRLATAYYTGRGHGALRRYDSAVARFLATERMAVAMKDSVYQWRAYAGLAISFSRMRDIERSITYTKRALAITMALHDEENTATLYSNLSGRYGEVYDRTHDVRYLDSVEYYTTASLPALRAAENTTFLAQAFNILGGLAYERKNHTLALAYADSTLAYTRPGTHPGQRTSAFMRRWDIHDLRKEHRRALPMADSMLAYARLAGNNVTEAAALERRATTHAALGAYRKALEDYRAYMALYDSTMNVERLESTTRLEQAYNKERNERTIDDLRQRTILLEREQQIGTLNNRVLIALCLVALLVIVVLVQVARQRALRTRQRMLETEQRLQRLRMNPHAFFNIVAVLQSQALRENPRSDLPRHLAHLATVMRMTLENSYRDLVTLDEERRYLQQYVELATVGLDSPFSYTCTVSPDLDPNRCGIPPMLIQPFIENAIDHGVRKGRGFGSVSLAIGMEAGALVVTIVDTANIVGPERGGERHPGYPSRAMEIVRDRLTLLGGGSHVAIAERGTDGRYAVTITLPLFTVSGDAV